MKNNEAILQYLKQQRLEGKDFVFEGNIEDYVRTATGSKGSTISRALRHLREDGQVISDKKQVGNKKYLAYGLPTGQLSL